MQLTANYYISMLPTSKNPLSCNKSTITLMRILIAHR